MKQYEAVIEVMKQKGGYATLGDLYQDVLKVPDVTWNTKTPYASIRRIVQVREEFFKIKPGLWALEEYRNQLPQHALLSAEEINSKEAVRFNHTYYQSLLVKLGNLINHRTYIPNQDKNQSVAGRETLGDIATLKDIYAFGPERMLKRARTIEVIWFNRREMPEAMFEVEHSTDMQNSLLKFVDLQDYNAKFHIVADVSRQGFLDNKLSFDAFEPIRKRVKFWSYEQLANLYDKTFQAYESQRDMGL